MAIELSPNIRVGSKTVWNKLCKFIGPFGSKKTELCCRLNLLENVYGAGFYGPLFFWLENWKNKFSCMSYLG